MPIQHSEPYQPEDVTKLKELDLKDLEGILDNIDALDSNPHLVIPELFRPALSEIIDENQIRLDELENGDIIIAE